MKNIADMDQAERPREKLLARGSGSLSDLELLAAILGRGSRGRPVMGLAREILKTLDGAKATPDVQQLLRISGVGTAKATLIVAALEFARRRIRPSGVKIAEPRDLLPLIRHYADRKQEHFLCSSLNGANEIVATRVVTVGLVNQSQVHPREVFADPITDRAAGIIVAHNHPDGSVKPSLADRKVTLRLREAGELLGIRLVDHLIFNHREYFSFAEQGLLEP